MTEAPHARTIAGESFLQTIEQVRSGTPVTEEEFRGVWLKNLKSNQDIIAEGWYDPPPFGIVVLSDNPHFPTRISYTSLRERLYWPSDRIIDFEKDILFAYCSPVSRIDGYMGDFDITLYFGKDEGILSHMRNCFQAVQEVIQLLSPNLDANTLYLEAEDIWKKFGLMNAVISRTDITPHDIGHSLVKIQTSTSSQLTGAQKNVLSTGRRFINAHENWKLKDVDFFTIEPQLRSIEDPALPQISFHYICSVKDGVWFASDIADIYRREMNLVF